ncbi:MAG: T9SS type A sorting domain-containing protein, partial [Bacteroidales bacterium]|nr:T9SS type A sorting domain-containing protein [Bacteroidales bacterium]
DFVVLDAATPGYSNLLTSVVNFTPEVFNFQIFPNPFSDKLQIKPATSYSGKLRFDFFNLAGRIVHQENKQLLTGSEIIIDLSNLSSGTYILRMQDAVDRRLLSTLKLIKR